MPEPFLPPELAELENRLCQRPYSNATDDLRSRLLNAVTGELATPRNDPSLRVGRSLQWAAFAASVLLVLNLSVIWASPTQYPLGSAKNSSPAISELEALRQIEAQQERLLK
jgi:hypothetical protein